MVVKPKIAEALSFLLTQQARYKVAYGGRGAGAKSWSCVRVLIVRAIQQKTIIVCAREVQKTIKESVHRLIKNQIEQLGCTPVFDITDTSIKCKQNGSEFIFVGLYRNIHNIKGLEDCDICFVEEAENVSEESWQTLLPTIRKPGSEIWVIFNPKYPDDPTYQRFVVNKPENCISKKVTSEDNPWFSDVLRLEMEADKAYRPLQYKNVWLGEPVGYGRIVWQDFDEKVHVRELPWELVKSKGNNFQGFDPHQHYYPASIWISLIPKNDNYDSFYKYIYAEYPTFEDFGDYFYNVRHKILYTGTLAEMSKQIYVKDGTSIHGLKIRKRFIDPRFATGVGSGNYWSNSTEGLVSQFVKPENGGLLFDLPRTVKVDSAKNDIVADLRYNRMAAISPFNDPNLIIAPWCKNVIDMFKNHRLQEDAEAEDEKRKDFSDAIKIAYAGIMETEYENAQRKQVSMQPHFISRGSWMGN